ncbi:MAG TPA: sigma factor-like helix-turn-helix DNA-binding protein, partial [Acidimicrobiales bacterium]|nr:sigma factor-like helix-turn-helix DNA-binding protein [Acidimicrobiales bacterium]
LPSVPVISVIPHDPADLAVVDERRRLVIEALATLPEEQRAALVLVDMEGYAVALTCARFDVTLRLVKHVSDNADDSAHDWPTAVAASAVVLGEWVERYLDDDA